MVGVGKRKRSGGGRQRQPIYERESKLARFSVLQFEQREHECGGPNELAGIRRRSLQENARGNPDAHQPNKQVEADQAAED